MCADLGFWAPLAKFLVFARCSAMWMTRRSIATSDESDKLKLVVNDYDGDSVWHPCKFWFEIVLLSGSVHSDVNQLHTRAYLQAFSFVGPHKKAKG